MISISKVAVPLSAKPGAVIGALTAFDAKGNLVTGVRFQTEADSLFSIDGNGKPPRSYRSRDFTRCTSTRSSARR